MANLGSVCCSSGFVQQTNYIVHILTIIDNFMYKKSLHCHTAMVFLKIGQKLDGQKLQTNFVT